MAPTLLTCIFMFAATTDDVLAPWASNHHPADVPRQHIEEITSGRAAYSVIQQGTMDGRNCRSPQGVWQPFRQTWESNRSVRMENTGETDVVNPWLSNGQNDFRNVAEIVARAVTPQMSPSEKARALWWQEVQYRYHLDGDNNELMDPVKIFNVYGHNTCGNDSISLAGLWHKAGLRVAPARLVGHCVSQVFYDGAWHLMDGDMHSIYLLRDNETVAGEQDLVRDHDLVKRTHTQGILQPDRRAGDEWESSIYVFEGKVNGDRNGPEDTAMNLTLRPGEALTWRWGHTTPPKFHGNRPSETLCNGLWEYSPGFSRATWRKGASKVEAIKDDGGRLMSEVGKTGVIVWAMRSPYLFVGGKLESEGSGARFAISWDGRTWQHAGPDLDRLFGPQGPARYAYYLRCELSGQANLRSLKITSDLQMAPLTLPGLGVGENTFVYTDQSSGDRKVRLTHRWVERSASRPPDAPREPIVPRRGSDHGGTDVVFEWSPAVDPDGDAIADYQFELSDRADMRWPLSMSFAKLISRTADASKPRYTLPGPGLLNPDRPYYWRVRAQDDKGVWGPWSQTWSFTPRGPSPPHDLVLELDSTLNSGILRWAANPKGRKPVAYRVYASDEKGFSVSDAPYPVTVGVSKDLSAEFPANFVAQTRATELEVVGPNVEHAAANKAFYRVVAVDSAGKRSGPSEYASAPRPVIFSKPVTSARQGALYHYAISAIRSLGDLRTRVVSGKETMSFWDVERPRFRIDDGPKWLLIDQATGLLSGTPDSAGRSEVVVTVTLESEQQRLDEEALKWGIEKVVSRGTMTVGTAGQRFVLEVSD